MASGAASWIPGLALLARNDALSLLIVKAYPSETFGPLLCQRRDREDFRILYTECTNVLQPALVLLHARQKTEHFLTVSGRFDASEHLSDLAFGINDKGVARR